MSKVFAFDYERVWICLQECVNTEFAWEVKGELKKGSISKTACLQECPLAGELTV